MERKTIDNEIVRIRSYCKSEQWFRAYDLAHLLLLSLEKNTLANRRDFLTCYIYMSNCMRRMGNLELALEFAFQSSGYADEIEERIMSNNAIANCHGEIGNNFEASKLYDKNINLYKIWIDGILLKEQEKDKDKLTLSMANTIQNKGYFLRDSDLVNEAIRIYKTLLNKDGLDKEIIKKYLSESYKSLLEINPSPYIVACQ